MERWGWGKQPVETAAARLGYCQFEILWFVKPSPKGQSSVTEKEILDREIEVKQAALNKVDVESLLV